PAGRAAIAAASANATAPSRAPAGLQQMSSTWRAPLADYELRFVQNSATAYFLCAALGVGVVIALASVIASLASRKARERDGGHAAVVVPLQRKRRSNFLEKTVDRLLVSTQEAL